MGRRRTTTGLLSAMALAAPPPAAARLAAPYAPRSSSSSSADVPAVETARRRRRHLNATDSAGDGASSAATSGESGAEAEYASRLAALHPGDARPVELDVCPVQREVHRRDARPDVRAPARLSRAVDQRRHGHAACSDGHERSAIAVLDSLNFAFGVVGQAGRLPSRCPGRPSLGRYFRRILEAAASLVRLAP